MLLRFDTIARTGDFDDRAAAMHLRPWQWLFLLAADGRMRLDDLARECGLEFETAADLVHETEALGLIEIVTQTLEDYRASHATVAPASALPAFTAPWRIVDPIAMAPQAMPIAAPPIEVPMKKLSVSFDALSSMFDDPAPTPAAAVAPVVHAEGAPIAFETPDHMAPLAKSALLDDVPVESAHVTHETSVAETVSAEPAQTPTKSVSFSMFAANFGSPETPFAHEPQITQITQHEISTNGHAAIAEIAYEPVAEREVVHEPAHDREDVATHEHDVEYGAEHAPKIAHVFARSMPEDDVLLQHFNVGANGTSIDPVPEDAPAKSNGDLTGTLLRALGLKK
jgi:hypothetical protein